MRCSWAHCGASFEGGLPDGWRWVFRQTSTGEHGCVCPDHLQEMLDADLRALLRMFETPGSVREVPRMWSEDDCTAAEETKRLLKGKVGGR